MMPYRQKSIEETNKKSLVVAYQHQYSEACIDASPRTGAEIASTINLSLDRIFSLDGSAFIESMAGDEMCRNGLVVLITSEKDWESRQTKLLHNLSDKGFNALSIVCGASADLSNPCLDQFTDPLKKVFVIRTALFWLNSVLGPLLWAYEKPIGGMEPNINDLVDAILMSYPKHRDSHIFCGARFEDESEVFTERLVRDIETWGEARYVFVSITSTDITLKQIENIRSSLHKTFPIDTTFGIQLGTDIRCTTGVMQLAAMVFYVPSNNRYELFCALH